MGVSWNSEATDDAKPGHGRHEEHEAYATTSDRIDWLWLLASAALTAADFWTKPFTEWSDKDAQKMTTESPWAVLITVPLPPNPPVPTEGGGGGQGFAPDPVRTPITLSWRSALPGEAGGPPHAIG